MVRCYCCYALFDFGTASGVNGASRLLYFCLPDSSNSPDGSSLTTLTPGHPPKSKAIISESVDKAMDKANPPAAHGAPGISIRNGPVDEMDIDGPGVNGNANGKRKARSSMGKGMSYKEASEEDGEEATPLVRHWRNESVLWE